MRSSSLVLLFIVVNSDQDMNTRNNRSKPRAQRDAKSSHERNNMNFMQKREAE